MAKQPQGHLNTETNKPQGRLSFVPSDDEQPSRAWTLITESKLEQTGAMTKAVPMKSLFTLMSDV